MSVLDINKTISKADDQAYETALANKAIDDISRDIMDYFTAMFSVTWKYRDCGQFSRSYNNGWLHTDSSNIIQPKMVDDITNICEKHSFRCYVDDYQFVRNDMILCSQNHICTNIKHGQSKIFGGVLMTIYVIFEEEIIELGHIHQTLSNGVALPIVDIKIFKQYYGENNY